MISAQQIKELREKTGAGISDVKKALEENAGDVDKAFKAIERKLGGVALKKADRETKSGLIDAYIHSNHRVGAMVEVFCETDFVARSPDFQDLAHSIAMQVAAMRPLYLSLKTIPQEIIDQEKVRLQDEVRNLSKPASVLQEIVNGKLTSCLGDLTLLEQSFVKDQNKTVNQVIDEAIGRFGENIRIGRFVRFEF